MTRETRGTRRAPRLGIACQTTMTTRRQQLQLFVVWMYLESSSGKQASPEDDFLRHFRLQDGKV